VLVVSAAEGNPGPDPEHVYLAKTLGSPSSSSPSNKMDRQEVRLQGAKFNELKEEMTKLLKSVGYKVDTQVVFAPISAFKDDNINKASPNMPCSRARTLLQALDNLVGAAKPTDKPLRLPVQDVYTITGIGTVPVGRVETGKLKVGDRSSSCPAARAGEVKSIEMHHEDGHRGRARRQRRLQRPRHRQNDIRRGEVAGPSANPRRSSRASPRNPGAQPTRRSSRPDTRRCSTCTRPRSPAVHGAPERLDPRTGQVAEEKPQTSRPGTPRS